jgi:hypothetical protein
LQRVWLLVPPLALLALRLVWLDLEQVGTMPVAVRKEVPIKSHRENIASVKIFACGYRSDARFLDPPLEGRRTRARGEWPRQGTNVPMI